MARHFSLRQGGEHRTVRRQNQAAYTKSARLSCEEPLCRSSETLLLRGKGTLHAISAGMAHETAPDGLTAGLIFLDIS